MLFKLKSFSRQASKDFSDLSKINYNNDLEDGIAEITQPRLPQVEKLTDIFDGSNNNENIHPNNTQPLSRKPSFNKVFSSTFNETSEDYRYNEQPQPLKDQFNDERFISSRVPSSNVPLFSSRRHDIKTTDELHIRDQMETLLRNQISDTDNITEDSASDLLFSKVRHNRIDFVERVIRSGNFNPRAVDDNGNTLLHICAQNNNRRIATLLLNSDSRAGLVCDVNAVNFKSHTPLDYAVKYGFHKLVRYLEAQGAVSGLQKTPGTFVGMQFSKSKANEQFSSRPFR